MKTPDLTPLPVQNSNVGRWDDRYRGLSAREPQSYGDPLTYKLGAGWLRDCSMIEDWGTGMGGFRPHMLAVNPNAVVRGIDGSVTPFADVVTDLVHYKSDVEAIFMRHVLEHDHQWSKILSNALESFQKQMVLILFTPMQVKTREIAWNGNDVPDIGFALPDLMSRFDQANVKAVMLQRLQTKTQYGEETVLFLRKET